MNTTTTYQPGVCNINPTEIKYRKKAGWAGVILTLVIAAPLIALHVNRFVLVVVFFPAFIGALGFLQAKHRFCVAYAGSGMQNASGDSMDGAKKVSATDRAKDKLKANSIYLQAAVAALAVTVIAVFVAGL